MPGLKKYNILPTLLQTIAWPIGRALLAFFMHVEVRGVENLRAAKSQLSPDSGIILAANHHSELDPILLLVGIPPFSRFFPMYYVAAPDKNFKDRAFGWRRFIYGGWFFKSWGSYPVKSGAKNYEYSLKKHISLVRDGCTLAIFPTGRIINPEDADAPAHGGVVYLTETTNAPIMPISIRGAYRASTRSFFARKHHVVVTYGPLIHTDEVRNTAPGDEHYRGAARAILARIAAL